MFKNKDKAKKSVVIRHRNSTSIAAKAANWWNLKEAWVPGVHGEENEQNHVKKTGEFAKN